MKYRVVLAARAICRPDIMATMPDIPGTEQTMSLDTSSGLGKQIWHGYLGMRQEQKDRVMDDGDWMKIRQPESADPAREIHKFCEAVNIFMRFLAGESRDNCLVVRHIEVVAQ